MMDTLPGDPMYIFIRHLKAKPDNVLRTMIFQSSSNDTFCVAHLQDYETSWLKSKPKEKMQGRKHKEDISIIAFSCKPPEPWGKEIDQQSPPLWSDKNSESDNREDHAIPEKHSTYLDKFNSLFTPFKSMCDGHLGSIIAPDHRFSVDSQKSHSMAIRHTNAIFRMDEVIDSHCSTTIFSTLYSNCTY